MCPPLNLLTNKGRNMKSITKSDILKSVRDGNIELIRFLYLDSDAMIRGYCSTAESLEGDLEQGHPYANPMPFFSSLDDIVAGSRFGPVGEVCAMPDPNTFRILPYKSRSAAMICDFVSMDTFEETGMCSRSILKKVLQDSEYEVKTSFENEFYLLRRNEKGEFVPVDESLCFATSGMNANHDVILDIVDALKAQGMIVEKYYPEYGHGQHEIVVKYDDALAASDNQVYFRETVRAVAANHELTASFMPKPFQELSGSGAHIHLSLWKDGNNIFYSGDPGKPYNDTARFFIGGVLKHIHALCAFTAPTITSYKRLLPQHWAAAYACYGLDNKEAAVRIIPGVKGNEAKGINLEYKPADPTCNPYLAMAALIAAGLDGIKNQIDPGEALSVDPASLSESDMQEKGVSRLPATLIEATDALEGDDFFRDVMGEIMYDEYIKLKKYNWNAYMNHVSKWEIDRYIDIF